MLNDLSLCYCVLQVKIILQILSCFALNLERSNDREKERQRRRDEDRQRRKEKQREKERERRKETRRYSDKEMSEEKKKEEQSEKKEIIQTEAQTDDKKIRTDDKKMRAEGKREEMGKHFEDDEAYRIRRENRARRERIKNKVNFKILINN